MSAAVYPPIRFEDHRPRRVDDERQPNYDGEPVRTEPQAERIEQEIAIPYWPKLAKAIGRDEQLFLAQLDYWISKSSNERDGRRWVYNTVDAWADQFCDMSRSAIGRTIKSLKEQGLIESTSSYNTRYGDRTQWYAINYDHPTLAPFLHLLKSKNHATMPYPTNGISDIPEMGHTYPTNGISDVPKSGFVKGTGDYVQEITQENIPPPPQNRTPQRQPGGAVQYTNEFERVYALIPKRDKKLQAFRVWEAIKPDAALAEQIARAMQQQVQANPRWRDEGARYCPALDVWLTNRRWEDAAPSPATVATLDPVAFTEHFNKLRRLRSRLFDAFEFETYVTAPDGEARYQADLVKYTALVEGAEGRA